MPLGVGLGSLSVIAGHAAHCIPVGAVAALAIAEPNVVCTSNLKIEKSNLCDTVMAKSVYEAFNSRAVELLLP